MHKGHSDWVSLVAFSHNWPGLRRRRTIAQLRSGTRAIASVYRRLVLARHLRNIAFSTTDSYLLTNRGTLYLTLSAATCYASYQGGGLSVDGIWITCNSKNVDWLPAEY